jgi:hypothetical protein
MAKLNDLKQWLNLMTLVKPKDLNLMAKHNG